MKRLFGSHENKLDAKGRVSVPAAFRNVWKATPEMTLVLRPSLLEGCVEAWPLPDYAKFQEKVDALAETDPEHYALASVVYSQAAEVELDAQGRIMIPAHLAARAKLADAVYFLGRGDHFHIWEPEAGRVFLEASCAAAPKIAFGVPAR
ncbi:MAG: division/cell wall cluster transcriptional repressor MraZ [Acidocella sp.]|uniref:division/cell wall cluster transcriptional repressor MraZ n=1 Tax=Acidocella sp. TaxID=50710 RepID=UPI003FC5807F